MPKQIRSLSLSLSLSLHEVAKWQSVLFGVLFVQGVVHGNAVGFGFVGEAVDVTLVLVLLLLLLL